MLEVEERVVVSLVTADEDVFLELEMLVGIVSLGEIEPVVVSIFVVLEMVEVSIKLVVIMLVVVFIDEVMEVVLETPFVVSGYKKTVVVFAMKSFPLVICFVYEVFAVL